LDKGKKSNALLAAAVLAQRGIEETGQDHFAFRNARPSAAQRIPPTDHQYPQGVTSS